MGFWKRLKRTLKKVGRKVFKIVRKVVRHWTNRAKKAKTALAHTARRIVRSIRNRITKWKREVEKHNRILRGTKTAKNIHNPKRRKKELAKRTKTVRRHTKEIKNRIKEEKDHGKKIDKAIKHDKNIRDKAEKLFNLIEVREWKGTKGDMLKELYAIVLNYVRGYYNTTEFLQALGKSRFARIIIGDAWPKDPWEWVTFAASMIGPAMLKAGASAKMTSLTKMSMSRAAFLQLVDKIRHNPIGMAKEFLKLNPAVRRSIIQALEKDAYGKRASELLAEAVAKLEMQKGGLAARILLRLRKVLGKNALLVIGYLLSLGFLIPWSSFEYILQTPYYNLEQALDRKDYAAVKEIYPHLKKWYDKIGTYPKIAMWLNPATAPVFFFSYRKVEETLKRAEKFLNSYKEETAQFTISSNPPGATIYVDGRSGYGTTPTKWPIKVTPGAHKITLEKPGFKPYVIEVSLAPGAEHDFGTVTLTPGEEPKGLVYIETDPPKARIFLGDTYLGRSNDTPIELPKGRYDLTLIKEGYEEKTITILIKEPGETVTQFVVLKPKENAEEEIRYYAGKGTVTIIPDPADAFITIPNEIYSWLGEITISLNPGKYSVQVRRDGYKTETKTFTVKAGDDKTIRIKLEPLPEEKPPEKELYRVDIDSEPPGAKILINDAFTGKWTPDYVILEAGEYELKLVKSGYEPWTTPLIL
ncbi:MAG: hypothetical protein DRJ03_19600 [Chloroflexi bacterium]|nr:MAG: hypothetical protein DRJ03_19600 [Chloroflexota bacterium]